MESGARAAIIDEPLATKLFGDADPIGRHGPSYAEDNEYIYGEWLGFSTAKIRKLEEDGII